MRTFFPEIEPYNTFRLKVSDIHELYVEECGNPNGVPVLFIHGGPGAGISKNHRRVFDPSYYRIVLFDQRGAGKSTPHACLEENTTWDLIRDMEAIRTKLDVDQWLLFGGSWGSTLSLAYAQTHPHTISGLILRGIFLCREEEFKWFYQEGCHWIYPDAWENYCAVIPPAERGDMMKAFYKRLTSDDTETRLTAARAWSGWEGATVKLIPEPSLVSKFEEDHLALSMARIECHYFMNNCFFSKKNQLLADAALITHIPTWIVHGCYDVVCPVKNAWELKKALPQATLKIVADAGHTFDEPGTLSALIEATEAFKTVAKVP